MPRVVVIHYDVAEAALVASRIRRENFDAEAYPVLGGAGLPAIRATPPDAVVIDLTRMPSYGRSMGALFRESKSLRRIPLVSSTSTAEGAPRSSAMKITFIACGAMSPTAPLPNSVQPRQVNGW